VPLSLTYESDGWRRRELSEEGHLVPDSRPELHAHRGKPLLVEQLRDERVQAGRFTPHDHIRELSLFLHDSACSVFFIFSFGDVQV